MILVFTESNFLADFICLKSKAVSTKSLHGFIFYAQTGLRKLFKNLILSVIWLKNGLMVLTKLIKSTLNITSHFINTMEL